MKLNFKLFLVFFFFSLEALAQSSGGLILKNADSMLKNDQLQQIELKGKVELIFQQQFLSADHVMVHLDKKQLEATGNVVIASSTTYAEAERLFVNYKTNQGVLYKAFVQSDRIRFSGSLVYKKGESEYEISDAEYTSCVNCRPSWSFTGSKIDAEFGGYAKIKNALLRVKGLPVFWLPYIWVPLGSDRQSGLLEPTFEFSTKGGTTLGLKYYHVNSSNTDSLYSIKTYAKRGTQFDYNYRYVLSPTDKGKLDFSYLSDKQFGKDYQEISKSLPRDPYTGEALDRWLFAYNHRFELPQGYTQRTQLYLISDSRYFLDFVPENMPFESAPALENRVSLTKNTETAHTSYEILAHRNLLKEDPLDANEDAVHRFPEISHSSNIRPIAGTSLYFTNQLNFTNFTRPAKSYDNVSTDPNATNDYDAGTDRIRTGHRLILNPKVYAPIKNFQYFDILPSVSLQSNLYQFGVPQKNRDYLAINPNALAEKNQADQHKIETNILIRSRFSRIYQRNEEEYFRHEWIPRIEYTQTPFLRRSNHSFFEEDPQDFLGNNLSITDTDKLQFDYKDAFIDQRSVKIGFENILTRKQILHSAPSYSEFLYWDLYQSYNFKEKRQPLSDITSLAQITYNHWALSTEIHYYPYQKVTNNNSKITYNGFQNSFVSLAYAKTFEVRKNKELDESTKQEDITLKSYYSLDDFKFGGSVQYSKTTREVKNYQVGFLADPGGSCWRLGLTHTVANNSGDSVTRFQFQLLFDGKTWSGDSLYDALDL